MERPDFAHCDLGRLARGDLRFLLENMPQAGESYEQIAHSVNELPATLESMLSSEYVFQLIRDRQRLVLDISPFLFFNVLLRRSLARPRSPVERRVINYLANLLTLFIRSERVLRIEPGDAQGREFVVELLREAEDADDPRREFMTYAHIGNYALWLTGLQGDWLRHRHQHGRRPVSARYYAGFGQSYFDRAAKHRMAAELGLDDVFLRLAVMFDYYEKGLNYMRRNLMPLPS